MTRDPVVTSRIMAAIPSRNTAPELLLRRELHKRGLRYRVRTTLPGHPDLVFPTPRVAVFVDGDYWHGNTWRLRGAPSFDAYFEGIANAPFWRAKITANMSRDRHIDALLTADSWNVVRVWESEIRRCPARCADRVEAAVAARRPQAGDGAA